MVFLQNSLRSLAGNFRAEFDSEQGIRIPEQGICALPEIPTRLSVADRVLDQFSADGAEENYLYCNPAPNGDKRHADR
jgi:hypothetical protein